MAVETNTQLMNGGLEPTEEYDGTVTVNVLTEDGGRERIGCSSYEAAIETVRDELAPQAVVKVEDRDGEVVFTSAEMDIDVWESEWRLAKRTIGADGPEHECLYGSVGCVGDDLCVRCKMDAAADEV